MNLQKRKKSICMATFPDLYVMRWQSRFLEHVFPRSRLNARTHSRVLLPSTPSSGLMYAIPPCTSLYPVPARPTWPFQSPHGSSRLSTLMIDVPGDLVLDLPCMQQASYLDGGPLMWMLPLYLHVNQTRIPRKASSHLLAITHRSHNQNVVIKQVYFILSSAYLENWVEKNVDKVPSGAHIFQASPIPSNGYIFSTDFSYHTAQW